jgi:hypothetical protein
MVDCLFCPYSHLRIIFQTTCIRFPAYRDKNVNPRFDAPVQPSRSGTARFAIRPGRRPVDLTVQFLMIVIQTVHFCRHDSSYAGLYINNKKFMATKIYKVVGLTMIFALKIKKTVAGRIRGMGIRTFSHYKNCIFFLVLSKLVLSLQP